MHHWAVPSCEGLNQNICCKTVNWLTMSTHQNRCSAKQSNDRWCEARMTVRAERRSGKVLQQKCFSQWLLARSAKFATVPRRAAKNWHRQLTLTDDTLTGDTRNIFISDIRTSTSLTRRASRVLVITLHNYFGCDWYFCCDRKYRLGNLDIYYFVVIVNGLVWCALFYTSYLLPCSNHSPLACRSARPPLVKQAGHVVSSTRRHMAMWTSCPV